MRSSTEAGRRGDTLAPVSAIGGPVWMAARLPAGLLVSGGSGARVRTETVMSWLVAEPNVFPATAW